MSGLNETIHLFVNRPNTGYVDIYKQHRKIKVFPMQEEEWENIKHRPTGWLACLNYLRALNLSENNIIVLEDDVVFHDNWYERTLDLVEDIEQDGHREYVLSLYSATLFTTRTNKNYAIFPANYFAGCQGIYFPKRVLGEYKQFLAKSLETEESKADIILGDWSRHRAIPIFTPRHSLVQHIGHKSSQNSMWHESPSFDEGR